MNKEKITAAGVCAMIIALLLLGTSFCTNKKDKNYVSEDIDFTQSEKIDTAKWISDKLNEIRQDSIKLKNTNFKQLSSGTNGDMSNAIDFLDYCFSWSYFVDNNRDMIKGSKIFDNTIRYMQNATKIKNQILPAYRKSFSKNLANSLWEKDIYITASGNQNSILNVTSHIFAANKNINDFQQIVNADVKHFGFKQVRYRWYKGAEEYTYFDLTK